MTEAAQAINEWPAMQISEPLMKMGMALFCADPLGRIYLNDPHVLDCEATQRQRETRTAAAMEDLISETKIERQVVEDLYERVRALYELIDEYSYQLGMFITAGLSRDEEADCHFPRSVSPQLVRACGQARLMRGGRFDLADVLKRIGQKRPGQKDVALQIWA